MKKLFTLSVLFIGFITAATGQISMKDQEAIRNAVRTMQDGWNARSGQMFSTSFAPTHDYIVWNGLYFNDQSRENNARAHQGIFDSVYKTTDVKLTVDDMRQIREDLVLVHVLGATYEHNTPVPDNPKVIISMLMEKQNSEWKIISFHNSDIEISFEPGVPNGSPVPPQAMFKSWYAHAGK